MLRAIQFNDQSGRSTVKVHDESADNPLFINFYWIFAEKKVPELTRMGCHLPAKSPGILVSSLFTLSVLAMLGHLSQRERQGMLARYTERCIEVRFYQFGKLEFTAPTLSFRLIALFHSIIWLSYMQEQPRQTLLPGLKLSYDHPHLVTPPLENTRFSPFFDFTVLRPSGISRAACLAILKIGRNEFLKFD